MTVAATLRGYTDKNNLQAVYIRITIGNKRFYKKTQIKVQSDQWQSGLVKSNHTNYKALNQSIRKLISDAETQGIKHEKTKDKDFYKYCDDCFEQWESVKAYETMRQHTSEIRKLKSFAPSVNLSSITPEWLNRYKAYLFSLKNAGNTVHKNLKFVRVIIRKAHKENLIERNPFDVFEMQKYRNPQKRYLLKGQIDIIEGISRDENLPKELRFVATWFVIGSYTGLRFGDMRQFNKKDHIINNRIILYTKKTHAPISIPLSSKLKALFEQINYRGVDITNTHFNRVLKHVGRVGELGELNAHMSRHSCAVMLANAKISMEVTANILGHTSMATTAIYYKLTNQRIDEELSKLE